MNGESSRGCTGKSASVSSRKRHRRRARRAAQVAQTTKIVAPAHSAASIICYGATIVVQPGIQLCRIARSIAFHRLICCQGVDRRRGSILNSKRRRRLNRQAAAICGSKGHGCGSRRPAQIAQRGEVIRPGNRTAIIAGCCIAMVVQPGVQISGIARSVAFYRNIRGWSIQDRRNAHYGISIHPVVTISRAVRVGPSVGPDSITRWFRAHRRSTWRDVHSTIIRNNRRCWYDICIIRTGNSAPSGRSGYCKIIIGYRVRIHPWVAIPLTVRIGPGVGAGSFTDRF